MVSSKTYVLAVGSAGEERLKILNEICNPYTHDFIHRIGLKPGIEILEIGCGIGIMTAWLAQQVGPTGKVTAIDISEEQIAIAQKRANEAGITNIEFNVLPVEKIAKLNKQFDLVYHRYVLVHIENPEIALHEIYNVLKSGGKIVSEEAVKLTEAIPNHPAINQQNELFLTLKEQYKTRSFLGLDLYQMFHKQGFKDIQGGIVAPIMSTFRERSHIFLVIEEISQSLLDSKLISKENLDKLISDLKALAADDNYLLIFLSCMQICGTK